MIRTSLFAIAVAVLAVCSLSGQSSAKEPCNWQERWDYYVRRTYSLKKISLVVAENSFQHSFEPRSNRAMYGFPGEIGGALARRTARNTVELGLGALLREDIRRRPSELKGIRQRALFAILHAPLARGPEGEWRPAYSRYAGTFAGVAVTAAWDGRPLTAGNLFENAGFSAANYLQDALYTEFEPDIKRLAQRYLSRHAMQIPGVQFGVRRFGLRMPAWSPMPVASAADPGAR